MNELKISLYKKISNIMRDVAYLSKDDNIEFKTTKYKAISEEKVTSAVRASMLEHGVIILPIEQDHKKVDTLTTVDTRYKIIDIDTGEYELIASSGTGVDTQDKGVGKAMTYSFKYLLLRTFAIPTGEDPDKISSAELDAKKAEQEIKAHEAELKIRADIKNKWVVLAGDDKGLEDWINKQLGEKKTLNQMLTVLTKRMLDKAQAEKEKQHAE